MSPPELDLTRGAGDEDAEPRERSERSKRRDRARERERQGDVGKRLGTIFERLAQSVEGRGDEELASMIREDKDAMVGGLVSLTSRAPALAPGVLGALAVLEPLIAFGRILRLLARRAGERRAARAGWEPDSSYGEPGEYGQQMPGAFEGGDEEEDEDNVARPWEL